MSMKYIRNYYGVPAKRGGRVTFRPGTRVARNGTITGTYNQYLRIRLDGQTHVGIYHPTDEMRYLPNETAA